jgi:diguanylate cyclase (GGDEF)-like protein
VAAELGLFPLAVLESAILAAVILATMAVAIVLWPLVVGGQSQLMTLWRLIVIAGIGALASLGQLHFLIRLTDQSTRDGLTGLLVRRVGEELLESQFAYAQRHKLPLSLLFIDLDNFKSVNDAFGHPAGDAALREAAASLKRAFRGQESVIRWGGEEFVIALPATDMSSALASVQRLAQLGIGQRPDGTPMTASIGIAESNLDRVARLQDLSDLADKRMYMAKKSGRNRYQAAEQSGLWLSATKTV